MIILYTLILFLLVVALNSALACLYNEIFPILTKKFKYTLIIPPVAILLWLGMIITSVFISLQNNLETYFKEGDE
jgi:thiosulfate reductase cytochrome b subunit